VKVDKDKSKSLKQIPLATSFVQEFLQSLMAGKANPDVLTVSFMKRIARPRPKEMKDEELGYDPSKVTDYLKKMGRGKYADAFSLIDTASGPFIYGRVTNEAGATEGFVLRLVPVDSTWKIDLFYRSRFVTDTYGVDNPGTDLIGAQLAAQCFIENLLGGELLIAEALLSRSWKVDKCWSKVDPEGYSPQLVQLKLSEWRGNYSAYSFVKRNVAPGKPAEFEIIAQKADNKPSEMFTLKVNKDANGEWLVDDVKVEPVKP